MSRRLVFVGPLSPPTTGASLVTGRFLDAVRREAGERGKSVIVVRFQGSAVRALLPNISKRLWDAARAAFLGARRCDSIYVALPGGSSLVGLFPLIAVSRLRGTAIYLHHHSFAYLNSRSPLFAAFFRLAGPDAGHVVLCQRMARSLSDQYCARSVTVLSNLAFVEAIDPPSPDRGGRASGRMVLGFLSNLDRPKGLDTVLEACRALADEGVDFDLLLAGPASSSDAAKLIDQATADLPQVRWLGKIDNSAVSGFFSQIDLFLFPSRHKDEAQPLVVLEAAANGVPTIGTSVGCLPDELFVTLLKPNEDLATAIAEYPLATVRRRELAEQISAETARWRGELDSLVHQIVC